MLGRYHGLEGKLRGFIVAETSDAKAIYAWLAPWMETVSFHNHGGVEDAESTQLLQNARMRRA